MLSSAGRESLKAELHAQHRPSGASSIQILDQPIARPGYQIHLVATLYSSVVLEHYEMEAGSRQSGREDAGPCSTPFTRCKRFVRLHHEDAMRSAEQWLFFGMLALHMTFDMGAIGYETQFVRSPCR